MKYTITKEQYKKLVDVLINVFFKHVEFIPIYEDSDDEVILGYDFLVGDEEVGWILSSASPAITKACKNELVIYTDYLNRMKSFAPLIRKKLFAKLLINHFSKLTGLNIDCFWIDEEGDHNDDEVFKYRIKKKKK